MDESGPVCFYLPVEPDRTEARPAWMRPAEAVATVAGLIVPPIIAAYAFLSFTAGNANVPWGPDTPSHLWRSKVVSTLGLSKLFDSSFYTLTSTSTNPDRVGLPTLTAVLRGTVNVGPWRVMFIAPALAAAIAAVGGWALARALREPKWAAPIYALGVGVSVPMAITGRAHLDNALADGIMIALAAVILRVSLDEPGVIAGMVLLGGAVLMHWVVGSVMVAVVGIFAGLLLPVSWTAWRDGGAWWKTPAARLVAVTGGGTVIGWGLLAITPGAHAFSTSSGSLYRLNVKRLLPRYRMKFAVPLAALGAVAGWFAKPTLPHRRALLLWAAWLVPILGGALAYARGSNVPVMRLVGIAFPVVFLILAALVGLIRLAGGAPGFWRYPAVVVAVAVVVTGLGWSAKNARTVFGQNLPMTTVEQTTSVRTAMSYVSQVDPQGEVVFVVDMPQEAADGLGFSFRRIRAFAPGELIPRTSIYIGDVSALLTGGPMTYPDSDGLTRVSQELWATLQSRMNSDAIVLVMQPFDRTGYSHLVSQGTATSLGDGVLLVQGPPPPPGFAPASQLAAPSLGLLARNTALAFLLLLVVGLGWAAGLLPGLERLEYVALAPALGMAVLTAVGVAVGLMGAVLSGGGGILLAVVLTLLGWGVFAWRRLRPRGRPRGAHAPAEPDPAGTPVPEPAS